MQLDLVYVWTALHMMQKLPGPAARPHPTVDRPPVSRVEKDSTSSFLS